MSKDILNEREFELVNIVGAKLARNQRDLSHQMNMSLGMTNMLLKRLVTKGYIRIKQLDSRKVQYLLTPKGFAEKMQKSVKYTLKTINSIGLIKDRLKKIMNQLYVLGHRRFIVVGKSDLAFMIDDVIKDEQLTDCDIIHADEYKGDFQQDAFILICVEEPFEIKEKCHSLNLIHELAKSENLIQTEV